MAEFKEVVKQRNRMHEQFECKSCPLSGTNNGHTISCGMLIIDYPQEAEEIIMKWAEENPIKTNADKFYEVFGILPTDESCPFADSIYCKSSCDCTCEMYDFWEKEYKEPKEVE